MHRSTILAVLLTCFVVGSYAHGGLRRTLKQRSASATSSSEAISSGGGSSAADASALSTGGSATAIAVASSEATTRVRNGLVKFFTTVSKTSFPVYKEGDDKSAYCSDVFEYIDEELVAVGEVVAEVYSVAIGDVSVEGEGKACANADTSGKAEATAFAEILVHAIINVNNGLSQAEAEAIVSQRNAVFASAFAEAYTTACIKGQGDAFAIQTVLSTAIAKPIATLVIFLFAEVDCSGYDGYSEVYLDAVNTVEDEVTVATTSDSSVNGEGEASADGGGDAITKLVDIENCSGLHRVCCTTRFNDKDTCTCTASRRGRGRCNAVKAKQYGDTVWDMDGALCKC